MAAKAGEKKPSNPLELLLQWALQRLERTWFFGLKFTLPKRFVSPLGFLGMLTFTVFIILGISGALLMVYYVPTAGGAFDSVQRINDKIAFGLLIRNVHYHASNAMVLLAVAHMFYQYFSGRYKLRYEMLWVTGIMVGTLTILEAYTGYDLLVNERGLLAINIGRALMRGTPFIGPILYRIMTGSGLSELVLRFYAFHVFIGPLLMIIVMLVHLPRALVLDVPVVTMVTGVICMVGGIFPVEMGIKFNPEVPVGITLPEWYLTGLYSIVRTGIPGFLAGVVIPTLFLVVFLVVPFFDTGRKMSVRDRPFFTALGVAGLAQILVTTVWGFRGNNPFLPPVSIDLLMINPFVYFGSLILLSAITYGGVYSWLYFTHSVGDHAPRAAAPPRMQRRYTLGRKELQVISMALLAFQLIFDVFAVFAYLQNLVNIALLQIGAIFVSLGVFIHVYRVGMVLP